MSDRLGLCKQTLDYTQGLVHAPALGDGLDAHHVRVGRQSAGADAHHHTSAGHVVEQHHPVGDHQRMVIGQADDAGAQLDVPGPLRRGGDEDLRRGYRLPAGAVVLSDPGLVEPQVVQPLNRLQVALERESGVVAQLMEGRHEYAEFHSLWERHFSNYLFCSDGHPAGGRRAYDSPAQARSPGDSSTGHYHGQFAFLKLLAMAWSP